jgi:hypothetical protein
MPEAIFGSQRARCAAVPHFRKRIDAKRVLDVDDQPTEASTADRASMARIAQRSCRPSRPAPPGPRSPSVPTRPAWRLARRKLLRLVHASHQRRNHLSGEATHARLQQLLVLTQFGERTRRSGRDTASGFRAGKENLPPLIVRKQLRLPERDPTRKSIASGRGSRQRIRASMPLQPP